MNDKNNKTNLFKLLIVFSLPYLAASLAHNGFLALLPFVREEFFLNRAQVGYYSTFIFVSSATLAIFTGSVVDKLGPKKGVLIGIGFISVTAFFFGLVPSYGILLFLALLAGLGHSIITPSMNKGLILSVPTQRHAVSMGIMQSGFGLGGILGTSLIPILGLKYGWQTAIQFAAFFAILVGFLIFKLYQERSNPSIITNQSTVNTKLSFKINLFSLFMNKLLLRVCVFGFVLGASSNAALAHFAVFLSEDLEMSRAIAGFGLSIYLVGGITGKITWGWASDRFFRGNRRKALFFIAMVIGVIYLVFGLFINTPQVSPVVIFLFSFILGCSAEGWQGVHLAAVGDAAGKELVGIATGLSLLFLRIGLLIAPPVIGHIADLQGSYKYSWQLFGAFVLIVSSFLYFMKIPQLAKNENNRKVKI